jgi:hypothetical protein
MRGHILSRRKRDRRRRWKRKRPTGFVRPQRKFFRAKMRLFRQLQRGLQQQMRDAVAEHGLTPEIATPETPEVKEIL